ncbi:MAG: exodeoxyribonuclease III [Pseudomonadota bacterium]|nr:exodeoxyribonuclease III [Pseudomonadota bacterium]
MRVITLNVNGLRSAERKGLADWLARGQAWDVACLQEIRCMPPDVPPRMRSPRRAHAAFCPAVRKGYSGVAVYTRVPAQVGRGFGCGEFDDEGRYLEAHFKDLTVVSVYFPSGSAGPHRQASKFRFLSAFLPHLAKLRRCGREILLCGDWNIAHQTIDLKNWRSNQRNSGFLPEEREWLSHVFDEIGFVDVFRRIEAGPDHYTWWSNRGAAWAKNVGWRIDYQIATPGIASRAQAARIYTTRRFSDHAPVVIDYDYDLA